MDSQGKEIYVGRGTFNSIVNPGRLLLEDNGSKTAGLYIESSGVERILTSNIEYYVKNPSCDYKWVTSSGGKTVPNAIKVVNPTKTYYVARVFAQNTLLVGKVLVGNRFYYSQRSRCKFRCFK